MNLGISMDYLHVYKAEVQHFTSEMNMILEQFRDSNPLRNQISIAINSHKLPEAYQWLKRTRICLIGAKVVGLYLKCSIASIQVCVCVAGVEEGCTIAEVPWDLLFLLFFFGQRSSILQLAKKNVLRNWLCFFPTIFSNPRNSRN